MSKEYIEREALLKHKRKMSGTDFCGDFWDEAVLCEDIRNAPAADVEPVRHGEWIILDRNELYTEIKCPKCHHGTITGSNGFYPNYCSNCGTKMDGGNK
jgi:hypothetical protein